MQLDISQMIRSNMLLLLSFLSRMKIRWKDICTFQVFPHRAQITLQLFELSDDFIQQEIRKPASHGNCSV